MLLRALIRGQEHAVAAIDEADAWTDELKVSAGLTVARAHLVRIGRIHPNLPADLFFTETEWTGAYVLNRKKPPKQPPSVRDVVRLIAQLGGFLARKGDGEPGVKSLWLGIVRLRDYALTVERFRTQTETS